MNAPPNISLNISEAAHKLHADALVIDGHNDSIGLQLDGTRQLDKQASSGHLDLPRMRAGGIDAAFFACYAPTMYQRHGATTHALRRLDQLHLLAERAPFTIAHGAADIRRAQADGCTAAIAGLEGAEALDADLGVLRQFYRLGIRNLGLAWNHRNAACDGVAEARSGGGLTPFGVEVVRECNRLGILLDISHLAPAGVRDVLALSERPIIASHSNAATLCDHPRNLTDQQLDAVAENGGVVGVTFVDAFLRAGNAPLSAASNLSVDDVADHVDYLLQRIGPDHVAIGSDYDGCTTPPDLADAARYPLLTETMLARGHQEATIRGVLGENFLRVIEAVCG